MFTARVQPMERERERERERAHNELNSKIWEKLQKQLDLFGETEKGIILNVKRKQVIWFLFFPFLFLSQHGIGVST